MIEDLSTKHQPLSNLFAHPHTREEWDAYQLSQAQIEFYDRNGYVAGIPMLADNQVEQLRRELNELVEGSHPARHLFYEYNSNESTDPATILFHALGAWRVTPGFHDLLWNPAFLLPAAQLLRGPVRFWHDQIFYKPAHHGGVVAWHQDYSYWTRTQPIAHLSCWIGLDDSTPENGCVHYVPGSHRWNLLPVTGLANQCGNHDRCPTKHRFSAHVAPTPAITLASVVSGGTENKNAIWSARLTLGNSVPILNLLLNPISRR